MPFPFNFDGAKKLIFNNEEEGMDFSLIHIGQAYREYMGNIGKRPLGEVTWRAVEEEGPMAYWMLGTPDEFLLRNPDGKITEKVDVILKVKPSLRTPEGHARNEKFFYGEIEGKMGSEEVPLQDIKGMSGCPIFALYPPHQGVAQYRVHALQSGWFRKQQLIR